MFKFIKKYAETVDGIELYPIVSLIIFFAFFAGVLWYVKKMSKQEVNEMENIPLD